MTYKKVILGCYFIPLFNISLRGIESTHPLHLDSYATLEIIFNLDSRVLKLISLVTKLPSLIQRDYKIFI